MKLNFKAILSAMVVAIMSASCVEGSLELQRPGLENVDATEVELSTLVSSDASRVRPFNVFALTLASADGSVVLDAKFVSDGQPLHAATYSPASFADAHKNTYVTGADGTTLTVNGVKGQVVDGNLVVTAQGGAYTVSGTVKVTVSTADGEETAYYELVWAGDAVSVKFKELPTLTKLSSVLSAQSNVANGTNTVTVQLATDGISKEFDMTTYQDVWKGTGAYLAVDFYSEDGYLAAGTYKACTDPAAPKAGEFVVGYDTTMDFGWGPMEFFNWGTCWWTVNNGTTAATKITAGEIYVAYDKKSKSYTIDIDNGTQYAQFVGEIPALTPKDKPTGGNGGGFTGTVFPTLLSATAQKDYSQVVLQVATDGVSATLDPNTWQTTYSGTGKIFNLTIHAEGFDTGNVYIPTGEYKAADGTNDPFTWQVTGGMPEYNFYWGSMVYDVVDGTPTMINLTEGTIWVGAKNGEYIINFESGDMKFRFTGAITGITTPADDDGGYTGPVDGEGGEGGDDVDYVVVPSFIYLQPGDGIVTLYLGQDGMSYSAEAYGIVGAGDYLKCDIYSADGSTLAPGTYTASAEGGKVTEGTFGIGWDPGDLWGIGWVFTNWGTCYMTKADDGSETGIKIEDGTMEVAEDGGNYVIKIKSSAMNLMYEGPLQ